MWADLRLEGIEAARCTVRPTGHRCVRLHRVRDRRLRRTDRRLGVLDVEAVESAPVKSGPGATAGEINSFVGARVVHETRAHRASGFYQAVQRPTDPDGDGKLLRSSPIPMELCGRVAARHARRAVPAGGQRFDRAVRPACLAQVFQGVSTQQELQRRLRNSTCRMLSLPFDVPQTSNVTISALSAISLNTMRTKATQF